MIRMSIKLYSELIRLPTYEDRFKYLQLNGCVGKDTFGHDRYINQILYRTEKWRKLRRDIIIRDNGCDLAFDGYEIHGKIIVHHLNPITLDDIEKQNPIVFDPENLICVTHITHNAIHYGDEDLLIKGPIIRTKNDTCPWKH